MWPIRLYAGLVSKIVFHDSDLEGRDVCFQKVHCHLPNRGQQKSGHNTVKKWFEHKIKPVYTPCLASTMNFFYVLLQYKHRYIL